METKSISYEKQLYDFMTFTTNRHRSNCISGPFMKELCFCTIFCVVKRDEKKKCFVVYNIEYIIPITIYTTVDFVIISAI